MSIKMRQGRFQRILVGLLVFAMVLANGSFASLKYAEAAVKAPVISSTSKDLLVGGNDTLKINNEVKNSTYQWNSSDSTVVSVSNTGVIKGLKKGEATVTCKVATPTKKYNLKCKVTVHIPAESISITNKIKEIKVGDTYDLNRAIKPKTSNDKTYWSSSDEKIAKPDKMGKFKALTEGTVTITATTLSGKKASVKIKVVAGKNEKTLTNQDVKDGVIRISNVTYDTLTIDNSVGDAEILLEKVVIKDSLIMESNAKYVVKALDSEITKVVSVEDKKEIVSMAIEDTKSAVPTFVAEKGTVVISVDARGNVSVRQEGEAEIGTITVNRNLDGNIELKLEGFDGNLVVNTTSNADIAIETKNCTIQETTISGTSSGQKLTLTDNTVNGASSNLGKINVETNAKLSIDVPAKELVISEKVKDAAVTLEKPVDKVVNEGAATMLTINSNVSDIVSKGEALSMKIAAGSTIKKVEMSGASSTVDVALGSKIESVISNGDNAQIGGNGSITEAKIEGNNTKITTTDTKVEVGAKTTGTVANGKELSAGEKTTPTTTPTTPTAPTTPTTPTTPTIPTTPTTPTSEKITITNPGDVYPGTNVLMKADSTDVQWSVYSYIDDSNGYAWIDDTTGELEPINTGRIRVVATSKKNSKVYGAVDIDIQAKRFVRMEALQSIIINSDEKLIGVDELEDSGKLPSKVTLVYETGKGTETEKIEVDITQNIGWYGNYEGSVTGTYLVNRFISVPQGYERPKNLFACVEVKVEVPQSDNRISVIGFEQVAPITLASDENCAKIDDLFTKHYSDLKVKVKLSDLSERTVQIDGYYIESGNQFNGAVPGTYVVNFTASIPQGTSYKQYYEYDKYMGYWNYLKQVEVPITIIVQIAQTSKVREEQKAPDTTQPRFIPTKVAAIIQSVSITNIPTVMSFGEMIDLNQYLTVSTDSQLSSDHRVTWTYSGYYGEDIIAPINGRAILNRGGDVRIRAVSEVDKTKFSEVVINVTGGVITGFEPLSPITVTEDKGILNFKTLYKAVESLIPSKITANLNDGKSTNIKISGWRLVSKNNNTWTLSPTVETNYQYNNYNLPTVTVEVAATQSDNRVTVVSGAALQAIVTLSEDRNATTNQYLVRALYQYTNNIDKVPVKVQLENGTELELLCNVNGISTYAETSNVRYRGEKGRYVLRIYLSLPEGYKKYSSNPSYDLYIEQLVEITQDQSPRYDNLWVSQAPTKLSYKVGEFLDLSGIVLMVKDFVQIVTNSNPYIGADKLSEHGIKIYLDNRTEGRLLEAGTPLTKEMNGKYIVLFNPSNSSETFYGPITVTE